MKAIMLKIVDFTAGVSKIIVKHWKGKHLKL